MLKRYLFLNGCFLICFICSCKPAPEEKAHISVTETIISGDHPDSLAMKADTAWLYNNFTEIISRYKAVEKIVDITATHAELKTARNIADTSFLLQLGLYKDIKVLMHNISSQPDSLITTAHNFQLRMMQHARDMKTNDNRLTQIILEDTRLTLVSLKQLSHYPDEKVQALAKNYIPAFESLQQYQTQASQKLQP
ncbi:MAG: hypothetical protein ABIT96_02560 [Ferruginibacter sp.]